ncbi:MAG: c-type cytochrome [Candidatus Acidiferrales bacterium]|jgi:mono/diheme cytochrome c family protein
MQRLRSALLAGLVFAAAAIVLHDSAGRSADAQTAAPASQTILHAARVSASDLEVGGELAGLPAGSTRYITREDLLVLPQVSYRVTGDVNFGGPTQVSGVTLEELANRLGAVPNADLVVAVCDDAYRANYPRAYIAAHRPLLVLEIDGKPPSGWPKSADGGDMGPYMISHPKFTPSFRVLAHTDEAQIPWGVIRLEFRDEKEVFGAIAPRGADANGAAVQAGYRIAQQNCFHCHNMGSEGGQKSGLSWQVLATWASGSPDFFAAYVRDPKSKNARAQMPGHPNYDDATVRALIAYFGTFSSATTAEKP